MKNKEAVVFGMGKETITVLDKLNLEEININKIYVDEDMLTNLSLEEIEDIILHSFYNCDTIICVGEIDLMEKMCKLFSRKIEIKDKCIFSIIFDDKTKDDKIHTINSIVDNTIIVPEFYVDVIVNTGNPVELARDIILTKCIRSMSRFVVEKLKVSKDNEIIFNYGKNNGFGTVFFESLLGNSNVNDLFKYLKYNNECSIFCIADGESFDDDFKNDLLKVLMKYGQDNEKNISALCTFCENKNIRDFKSIVVFALGY